MLIAAIHGFFLAFPLIIPLGAQNVFIFSQGALQPRFYQALPVVLTACLCDTLLITLAVTGVSVLVLGNFWIKTVLLLVGLIFLLYMGWMTWNSKPPKVEESEAATYSSRRQVVFALSVSLLNPHAIMDTVGVIGTNSLNYTGPDKLAFALATITVSWIWFFSLAFAGRALGKLDTEGKIMVWVNKVSAVIMWGAAVYIGFALFR